MSIYQNIDIQNAMWWIKESCCYYNYNQHNLLRLSISIYWLIWLLKHRGLSNWGEFRFNFIPTSRAWIGNITVCNYETCPLTCFLWHLRCVNSLLAAVLYCCFQHSIMMDFYELAVTLFQSNFQFTSWSNIFYNTDIN